ncbi:Os04g0202700 [Oryza sativa Japonica Group]|uniref:Os04g0202700 protein n=4 Tax=Oryza TaxID=4527 RepID=Q0JEU4_ORYSJ|nr:Os04g0202700 [Oryza sativa Japonica Group]BAS88077.1 Os04g0202700 [Oryza sativa Japonica Group]|eukprot:NP_001052229.1 Os04g0202700 [Oryza sativa Japonica Group]
MVVVLHGADHPRCHVELCSILHAHVYPTGSIEHQIGDLICDILIYGCGPIWVIKVSRWNCHGIKCSSLSFHVKKKPAIGVICGKESAAELHSRGQRLCDQDGVCWVLESFPADSRASCSSNHKIPGVEHAGIGCTSCSWIPYLSIGGISERKYTS